MFSLVKGIATYIKSFKGVDDIDYQWYIDEAKKLVDFDGLEQGEDDED